MKNKLHLLVFLLFAVLFTFQANATHIMGGNINYRYITAPSFVSRYEVKVEIFRDCNGITMPSVLLVNASASGGCSSSYNVVVPLAAGYPTVVTPTCPSEPDVCLSTPGAIYGVEKYVYIDTFDFASGCDWQFSWTSCCRNNAITTLNNSGNNSTYLSSKLNMGNTQFTNHSPVFLNDPLFFTIVNQPTTHSDGAYDPDGDSLVFSLSDCLQGQGNPVTYASGYNATNPLSTSNGLTIDPATGLLSFTPNAIQQGVINIKVEEYRNGVKIGEVNRDVYVAVTNGFANNEPRLSGINGTANINGTTGGFVYDVYLNTDTIMFDLEAYDADVNQTLTWTTQNLPNGATLSNNGNPNGKRFFWVLDPSNFPTSDITFAVKVFDDACPVLGRTFNIYTLKLTPFQLAGTVSRSDGTPLNNSTVVMMSDNYTPMDTFITNANGGYSLAGFSTMAYLKVIPDPVLHSDQMITYYDYAPVIQSATLVLPQP